MKKVIQIFLAGVMVVLPFAATAYVIYAVGHWLDTTGLSILPKSWRDALPGAYGGQGLGVLVVIGMIFLVGLLTHFWLFRWVLRLFERLFQRLPGIKTIYESVRDLLKLFGRDSKDMGRVVLYRPPGSSFAMLGILTNDRPPGAEAGQVAVYLPLAYMIGGPVLFVPRDQVQELDMPVETALKLCATAHISSTGNSDRVPRDTAAPDAKTGPTEAGSGSA